MGRSNVNLTKEDKDRQKWFRKLLGIKIKIFRLKNGYQSEQMAEFLQVSRNHYNKLEKGDVTLSDWYLGIINNVLELTPEELQSLVKDVDLSLEELKTQYFLSLVKIEEIKEEKKHGK